MNIYLTVGKGGEVATGLAEQIGVKTKCLLGPELGEAGREDIKENEAVLTTEPWKGFNLKAQDTANDSEGWGLNWRAGA